MIAVDRGSPAGCGSGTSGADGAAVSTGGCTGRAGFPRSITARCSQSGIPRTSTVSKGGLSRARNLNPAAAGHLLALAGGILVQYDRILVQYDRDAFRAIAITRITSQEKSIAGVSLRLILACVLPATHPALTSVAAPRRCVPRLRRLSAGRPIRPAVCLGSRRYRADFAAA